MEPLEPPLDPPLLNGFDINDLTIALERRCSSLNDAIKASWPAEMASTLTI